MPTSSRNGVIKTKRADVGIRPYDALIWLCVKLFSYAESFEHFICYFVGNALACKL